MERLQTYISSVGGLKPAAQKFGVSYQAVQRWLKKGEVPHGRVKAVHRVTKIKKSLLNKSF